MFPEIVVDPVIKASLVQGHPWVYRNHLRSGAELASGTWVRLRCGDFSAVGLYDAQSSIAIRVFSRTQQPDVAWLRERVWEAWETRGWLRLGPTNAFRWIFGESDGLPGIVVDRYGDYAVVQTYAESLAVLLPLLAPALRACDPSLRGVLLRHASDGDGSTFAGARVLLGEHPPADLVVQEHGLFFHADVVAGQKTGLFLDQRENRHLIETVASGARVLNCFAYTGGFSLYALRGGADHVTSADSGHGLAAATEANIRLNPQLESARHTFMTSDCFTLLEAYGKQSQRFDLLILDPPSFARTKAQASAAQRAYVRINSLALGCIEPGGLLATASCTSQIGPEPFRALLAEAATRAKRRLLIVHEAGQPADHPVAAQFPEGRYLKFVMARVLPLL